MAEPSLSFAWHPNKQQIETANVTTFLRTHQLSTYDELLKKAKQDPNWFYPAVLDELDIKWQRPFTSVLDTTNGIEWATWFKGGKTNLYSFCIEKHLQNGNSEQAAVIWESESGDKQSLTYRQLDAKVNDFASGLVNLGIEKGDRVGIYLPFVPEVPIALLACAKIGAIVIPIFSGYAADAVASRLADCNAKLLITADGYERRGKLINMKHTADQACDKAPSIKHVLVLKYTNQSITWYEGRDHWYDELPHANNQIPTESMNSDEPFMILYTSGTTGKPKGTVHTHTGFPVKSALDMYFCFDVKASDRIFWLTDFGWMMGPWLLLGTFIFGATVVLYDGSPDYPKHDRLWELIETYHVSILGLAPTAVRSFMAKDDKWVEQHDLSSLRILGSTGEAWNENAWYWFLEHIGKNRCPIINYSGGTEISGGILGCLPTLPLKPRGFHGPIPGTNVKVAYPDDKHDNHSAGELTLTNPVLGMTKSFWNDDDRYIKTYWSERKGIWTHGDLVTVDDEGFWYIQGRSDDTIKAAGKRLGPAELESILTTHEAVKEAAVIGVPHDIKGQVPVAFIVVHESRSPSEQLKQELEQLTIEQLGKALKLAHMTFVRGLPKTQNHKVARRLIRAKFLNQAIGDVSTIQHAETLADIPANSTIQEVD